MAQCEICGTEMVQGRGRARRTCSPACRQAAHRRRQAAELAALRQAATRPAPPTTPSAPAPAPDAPQTATEDERTRSIRARELADALAVSAGRIATALNAGLPADPFDVDRLAVIPRGLIARARAAHPTVDWDDSAPVPTVAVVDLTSQPPTNSPAPAPVSRNEPKRPRRMTRAQAETTAGTARLTRADRESGTYDLVTPDGAVLGHVAPGYRAGRRSGWHGWAADMAAPSGAGTHRTRDDAAAAAAAQWVRLTTTPPRR